MKTGRKKGFGLPYIFRDVPPEVTAEISEQATTEIKYEDQKQKKIKKAFENPSSSIRKVAEYIHQSIWNDDNKEFSYEELARELGLKKESVKQCIAELNYFEDQRFPYTMIPVPKSKKGKAGYIQTIFRDRDDYDHWDRKKMRTISTMAKVKDKAGKLISSKKRIKRAEREREQVQEVEVDSIIDDD